MQTLRISMFGQFSICNGERIQTSVVTHKAQELFCYLLLRRDRPVPRALLASIMWENCSTAQSKKNLRQTLWQLQTALGALSMSADCRIVLADADTICLNPAADLWLDVAVFEQAYHQAERFSGQTLDACQIQALQNATDLYAGDLLEDWYQEWCLSERERLENMYLVMLEKVMDYCEAHRDYETGFAYADRALKHDPARERTHRRLMRLHYFAGNRTAALRQYERCVQRLAQDLAVKPAASTVKLYEQIRDECLTRSSHLSGADILARLEQFQTTLVHTQAELQHLIQSIRLEQ